eukprot:g6015.t1
MTTDSANNTILQLSISLQKFQSQLPNDGPCDEIPVAPLVELLDKTLDFPECILDLGKTGVIQLDARSTLTWQSSTTNETLAAIELLETLLNEPLTLKLRNNDTAEVVALATCSIDDFIPGNNPIELNDVPLVLIEQETNEIETLAKVSFTISILRLQDGEQKPDQIIQVFAGNDQTTTVVDSSPIALHPVPQNLEAASALTSSQLDVVFGMNLLQELHEERTDHRNHAPLVFTGSVISEGGGGTKWRKGQKRILTATCVERLKDLLTKKQTVAVEIWRQLSEQAMKSHMDPAFEQYNAIGLLDLSPLLTPGTQRLKLELEFNESLENYLQNHSNYTSLAPVPVKNKTNSKLKPIEDVSKSSLNAWKDTNSVLSLILKLSRPLIPPWTPPERPMQTLKDLLKPANQNPRKADKIPVSWTAFKNKVKEVATSIIEEAGHTVEASSPIKIDKEKLEEYKDQLRKVITDIAKEMFGPYSLAEIQGRRNQLYVRLMQLTEEAIMIEKQSPNVADQDQLTHLGRLAREYEAGGMQHMARRRYLDALVLSPTPQTWTDYGAFCLRMKDGRVGEESLRRALMQEEDNLPALILLSCSCLCSVLSSDEGLLTEARVFIHEALEKYPESIQVWELLTVLYKCLGSESEERNCRYKVHELHKQRNENLQRSAFIDLAQLCIEHNLTLCAERLLYEAEESTEKTVLQAKMALVKREFESTLQILKTCSVHEGTTKLTVEIDELRAQALFEVISMSQNIQSLYPDEM